MILHTGPEQSSPNFTKYTPDNYEALALATIQAEKIQWEEMPVNVARRVQYLMKNVVDQARRYVAGVFENQYDEVTGDKKLWAPITKTAVMSVKKSIDLDTKDVLIMPGKPSTVKVIPAIKALVLNLFKKINFGQLLNDFTEVVATDGTVIVKNFIDINPNTKKKEIKSVIVDFMNFWTDPSVNSIQEAPTIERSVLTKYQIEAYKGIWNNVDDVAYTNRPNRLTDIWNYAGSSVPCAEVWERWGPIPKSWVTKNKEDDNTMIEGHIIASGVGSPSVMHLIRKNPRKDGRKPYEECWYRRVPGRWPGEGVPEMLFDLQEYANEIINTRRSNNRVLQNGIFLIRKGSGITPDMLNAITAGGGLPVTNINNDIKQLPVQDFRQSSYTDEDRVQLMADRVTGAFDITRGEVGRASASATATLTRDRNIRDTFVLVQENIGFFIERLIRHHYIPLLQEIMTEKDFITITGDADYLAYIDELIIEGRKNEYIAEHINKTSFMPEQEDIDKFIQSQHKFLRGMGKQRFLKYFRNMFDEEFDVEVHITDEKFNRVVAVQQLRDALIAFSRLPVASKLDTDAILREMFNIMGIKGEFFLEKPQLPVHMLQSGGEAGRLLKELPEEVPNEVTAFENAQGLPQQQPQAPFQTQLRINTGFGNLTQ